MKNVPLVPVKPLSKEEERLNLLEDTLGLHKTIKASFLGQPPHENKYLSYKFILSKIDHFKELLEKCVEVEISFTREDAESINWILSILPEKEELQDYIDNIDDTTGIDFTFNSDIASSTSMLFFNMDSKQLRKIIYFSDKDVKDIKNFIWSKISSYDKKHIRKRMKEAKEGKEVSPTKKSFWGRLWE